MPRLVSIVVPVFNESENVLPLAEEVAGAMEKERADYELVFVDDASSDGTWERIGEARERNPRIRGLRHRERSGQSAAVWTGIQGSQGAVIATMDGDRQNDPADYPRLLKELESADFVCGWRSNRKDSGIRKISSGVARKARKAVLGAAFRDTGCAMRVFKRECLQGVFPFNGLHRFLPILVQNGGFRCREVEVNHRSRVAGVSKYGIGNRLWRGILDLLAMWWYQKRRIPPVAVEELEGGGKTSKEPGVAAQ